MNGILEIKPLLDQLEQSFSEKKLSAFSDALLALKHAYGERVSPVILENDVRKLILELGSEQTLSLAEQESNTVSRLRNSGLIQLVSGDFNAALLSFSQFFEYAPNDPYVCYWAGKACVQKGLYQEALQLFLSPGDQILVETHLSIAKLCMTLGKEDEAIEHFKLAAVRENTDIAWLTYIFSLKSVLDNGNRNCPELEGAYLSCLSDFKSRSDRYVPEILALEADTALWNGDLVRAVSLYVDALSINPTLKSARPSLGYCLLTLEHFEEGFPLIAYRDELDQQEGIALLKSHAQEWFGEELSGKSILVYAEQGLGDQVFLCRYISRLRHAVPDCTITVYCDERLASVFRRSLQHRIEYCSNLNSAVTHNSFDYYVRTGELQAYLEQFDDIDACRLDRYLVPDQDKLAYINRKYANEFGKVIKLGLCWKSFSPSAGSRKNVELSELKPLFQLENVQWISLQTDITQDEIDYLKNEYGITLYVDSEVHTKTHIDDLCTQIESLDGVVSVSSTVVHLAGALGVKTFCLLPKKSFWYWHSESRDSRWYRSVSLYRQVERFSWAEPLEDLIRDLKAGFHLKGMEKLTTEALVSLNNASEFSKVLAYYKSGLITMNRANSLLVGKALLELHESDLAGEVIRPLLEKDLNDRDASILFAKVAMQKGLPQQAYVIIKEVENYQDDIDLLLMLIASSIEAKIESDQQIESWSQVVRKTEKIADINKISEFLADQRKELNERREFNEVRLAFLLKALPVFGDKFNKVNPVLVPAIMGDLCNIQGDPEAAINKFKKVIELKPELKEKMNSNIACSLLTLGRFNEGFKLSSSRLTDSRLKSREAMAYDEIPLINDLSDYKERTVLVTSEQGLGDQVLFWQFLIQAIKEFSLQRVVFMVPQRLVDIAKRTFPASVDVYNDLYALPESRLDDIDGQLSLGDVPASLFTDEYHFDPVFAYLKPRLELIEHYRAKYQSLFPGKKLLGLSWRSASPTWGGRKDIALKEFSELVGLDGWQAISIQYDATQEEIAHGLHGLSDAVYLDDSFDSKKNIEHCLAQIAALDHVVTVSNVNAHFSGAIGIDTTVLVKRLALWHWGKEEQSVWYPSVNIVREDAFEDWEPVFNKVKKALVS